MRGLAGGMGMDVRQALLHHAESNQFQFAGQTAEISRNVELDLQAAALGKTLCVPIERRRKTAFFQQRGGWSR
jgi:hypothetical protein